MDSNAIFQLLGQISEAIQQSTDPTFDIKKDSMMTMDQVCHRIGVHRNTLFGWIKSGKFPQPIMVCGQKRWSSSSINQRIYEDNPHLRQQEHLMAEARRISCPADKNKQVEAA